MNDYQPIIDVTPLEHSSEQSSNRAHVNSSSRSNSYHQPSWNSSSSNRPRGNGGFTPPYGAPYSAPYTRGSTDSAASSKTAGSVIGGIAQVAIGSGLILIGIPMLVLPGPGLLSIAGGAALAANGMHKIFG